MKALKEYYSNSMKLNLSFNSILEKCLERGVSEEKKICVNLSNVVVSTKQEEVSARPKNGLDLSEQELDTITLKNLKKMFHGAHLTIKIEEYSKKSYLEKKNFAWTMGWIKK